MRKLDAEGRQAYIEKKAKEREDVQKSIKELAAKRDAFVKAETEKLAKTTPGDSFDAAVRDSLRKQAESKGFKFEVERRMMSWRPSSLVGAASARRNPAAALGPRRLEAAPDARLHSATLHFRPAILPPMPAKILVLSASVGAGHLRAAQAVELALKQLAPGRRGAQRRRPHAHQRRLPQGLRRGLPRPRQQGPARPGVLLRPAWTARRSRSPSATALRLARREAQPLEVLRPGRVRAVGRRRQHPLPARRDHPLAEEAGSCALPQVTVVTDFDAHAPVGQRPATTSTAAPPARPRRTCETLGVPREHITVTGIPIHPVFSKPRDRGECLEGPRPHAATGRSCCNWPAGSASGRSRSCYRAILSIEQPLEVVAVAGRNEKLEGAARGGRRARAAPGEGDGLHRQDRRADGRRRRRRLQARRADELRSPRPRRGDGDRQPDPGPGEPQQRLPAGARRRDQDQQRRDAAAQAGGVARGREAVGDR